MYQEDAHDNVATSLTVIESCHYWALGRSTPPKFDMVIPKIGKVDKFCSFSSHNCQKIYIENHHRAN